MSTKYGANTYKKTSVETANKPQILLMLYEAAIQHVKKAIYCIDKNDMSNKGKSIVKAHDIINELSNTLDFDVGGEIAINLERLYNFIIDRLIKGNIENSKEHLNAVVKVLENLYEGWKTAIEQINKGEAK